MELTYHRKGDYLFPNLVLEEKDITIGKYGMLRRTFLKEHKKGWYQSMLLSEKLDQHLVRIEKAADKRIDVLYSRNKFKMFDVRTTTPVHDGEPHRLNQLLKFI